MGVGEETSQTVLQISSKAALMTTETLIEILRLIINAKNNNKLRTNNTKSTENAIRSGKQSLRALSRQNVALDSIPVSNVDIKAMTTQLRRYGIDFSVTKNKATKDFSLFFKGSDTAAITTALEQIVKDSSEPKTEKKPLNEQRKQAQEKADSQNKSKAAERAKSQEQQKGRSNRERER